MISIRRAVEPIVSNTCLHISVTVPIAGLLIDWTNRTNYRHNREPTLAKNVSSKKSHHSIAALLSFITRDWNFCLKFLWAACLKFYDDP